MLSVKDKGLLVKIIKHCQRIESKVSGVCKECFEKNEDLKEIVCFNIFQIGELVKHLSKEFTNNYNKMPWSDICGMRDIIVHGYGTVELDQVWQTISEEITPLKEYCDEIVKQN